MRQALTIVILTLLLASPAQATTLMALEFDQLEQRSDLIVRGHVEQTESFWDGRLIVTETTIVVDECLSGECGTTHVVRQVGGQVDDLSMAVAGLRTFEPGDELVLFLHHVAERDFLVTTGQCQGIFQLEFEALSRNLADVILVTEAGLVESVPGFPSTLDDLRHRLVE